MIDISATMITVWVIWTIVIGGGGFWLHGILSANKGEDDKHDFYQLGCVHPTCQRRKAPYELIEEKQLNILKRLYPEYIKQCEKEKDLRVKPCKTAIEKTESICFKCIVSPCEKRMNTYTVITKCENFSDKSEPNDTPSLCARCIRAEGCVAAVKGAGVYECENFEEEA